jgi:hypothetical protein
MTNSNIDCMTLFSRLMHPRLQTQRWRSFYPCSKNTSQVRPNPYYGFEVSRHLDLSVHDIKPLSSRTAESTGSLTPSGSRAFAPVPIATPAPVLPRDDPDYVWDVFYHRAGLINEYDAAANIGTVYVNPRYPSKGVRKDDLRLQDGSPRATDGRICLCVRIRGGGRSGRRFEWCVTFSIRCPSRTTGGFSVYAAEEYYKNDYPDEESSDHDGSEGSDGAYPIRIQVPQFFLEAALRNRRFLS